MLLLSVIVGIALCVSTATAIWALVRVSATVHEIQTERERNIRDGCADQNARHNETIRRLLRIGRDRDAIRRTTLRRTSRRS